MLKLWIMVNLDTNKKKEKEAKKKQKKVIVIKEIKLSVKIAENDISYKVKHAREFLKKEIMLNLEFS